MKDFFITIQNQSYPVVVTSKYQRNIYFRFRDGKFLVSAPRLCSKTTIVKGLEKYGEKLIKNSIKASALPYSLEEGYIWLLGERIPLKITTNSWINCSDVGYLNTADLEKNLRQFAHAYILDMVRKYEEIMDIKTPYRVSIKKMSSRWGSNSWKTHRVHFALNLIHYSPEIIASVVVHELAHEWHHNHQKEFYNCVLQYCPNYKELNKKLKKREYK